MSKMPQKSQRKKQLKGGAGYSSGVYGNVLTDGNINDATDATAAANNALKQYGIIPQVIRFKSYTLDWVAELNSKQIYRHLA